MVAPGSASGTFAANHGANVTTVFTGALNVPATTSVPWPAAFVTPIPFAQPVGWNAAAAQSLVIEYQTTGSSNGQSWSMEGLRAEWGFNTNERFQSNCHNSVGNASNSWGWNPSGLVPGGTFNLSMYNYPQNPSLVTNALFFGLTGQGSQFGPLVTPFLLTSLGLPSTANCNWSIGILGGAGFPMNYRTSGTSAYLEMSNVPLPNSPSFAGATFYTQNLAVDFDSITGQANLFPSIAIEWLIGTGNTIPCTAVRNLSSSAVSATGIESQTACAGTPSLY